MQHARPSTPTHNSIIIDDIITLITNKSRQPSLAPERHTLSLLWSSLLAKPMPQQYHYTPTNIDHIARRKSCVCVCVSCRVDNPFFFSPLHFFPRAHLPLLPLENNRIVEEGDVDRIISVVLQCLGLCI